MLGFPKGGSGRVAATLAAGTTVSQLAGCFLLHKRKWLLPWPGSVWNSGKSVPKLNLECFLNPKHKSGSHLPRCNKFLSAYTPYSGL